MNILDHIRIYARDIESIAKRLEGSSIILNLEDVEDLLRIAHTIFSKMVLENLHEK